MRQSSPFRWQENLVIRHLATGVAWIRASHFGPLKYKMFMNYYDFLTLEINLSFSNSLSHVSDCIFISEIMVLRIKKGKLIIEFYLRQKYACPGDKYVIRFWHLIAHLGNILKHYLMTVIIFPFLTFDNLCFLL